jgi:hypothetical protein
MSAISINGIPGSQMQKSCNSYRWDISSPNVALYAQLTPLRRDKKTALVDLVMAPLC